MYVISILFLYKVVFKCVGSRTTLFGHSAITHRKRQIVKETVDVTSETIRFIKQ